MNGNARVNAGVRVAPVQASRPTVSLKKRRAAKVFPSLPRALRVGASRWSFQFSVLGVGGVARLRGLGPTQGVRAGGVAKPDPAFCGSEVVGAQLERFRCMGHACVGGILQRVRSTKCTYDGC
jgi:hypothetical protein